MKVLNLGCGNDFYGDVRLDLVKTKATTHVANVEKTLPFKDSTFDTVYTRFIFEHLKNPNFVLKECYRILKKGGNFILYTDNAGFWGFHSGKYTKTLSTIHYGGYTNDYDDRHYALYTPEHIKNHLISAGFNVKEIKYIPYEVITKRASWKAFVGKLIGDFFTLIGLPQVTGYAIYAEGIKA